MAPASAAHFSGKWDAPEGNGTTLAAQLSNLREGRAYINFHTTQFGGGEIRGNFPPPAFRDALVAGLNGATETRATVLRKVAEQEELRLREFNANTATIGFFNYLRRDPTDIPTFNNVLNRLNSFGGNVTREMARLFVITPEYRNRFGAFVAGEFPNQAPDAVNDTVSTNTNAAVTINVLANDTDFENNALSVTTLTPGTGGTPSLGPNNTVIFTPTPGFNGAANFQYTITDNGTKEIYDIPIDDPKTDTATVTVNVAAGALCSSQTPAGPLMKLQAAFWSP